MKRRVALPLWCVCIGIVVLCLSAVAVDTGANPYQPIIDRNVFGLKPPVQATNPVPEEIKPTKVQLIGLANMFGKKTAIIKFVEPPKPNQPVPQEPLVLSEGEAAQDIEVIEIDEKAGLAKILNKGKPVTLDIKDYAATLPGSSGGTPQPGAKPGPQPTLPRMASVQPQRQPGLPVPAPATQPQPVRPTPQAMPSQSQSSPDAQAHSGGVLAVHGQPGTGGGLAVSTAPSIPQRPVRTPEPPQIPYEEQVLMIELERERTRELFLRGEYPPLPPTELTPEEDLKQILAPPPMPPGQ